MTVLRIFIGLIFCGFLTPPVQADLVGHGGIIRAIDFSADGRQVLTGSFDFSAIIWDFEEQSELARLEGHEGPVTNALFMDDGKRAVTTSDDHTTIIWDLERYEPIHRLSGHGHKVMALSVSPDNRWIATGGWDGLVILWDAVTGEQIRQFEHPAPINAVVFLDEGRRLASAGHDRIIRIFESRSGRPLGRLEGHLMGITQMAAARHGTQLISASIDGSLRIWDAESFKELSKLEGHNKQVFGVRLVGKNQQAVSVGRDGFIIHWDLETGQIIRKIRAHEKTAWAVAVSPDGRFVVSSGSDERARVWHLESGDRIGAEVGEADEPKPWLTSDHPGAKLYLKCARCHSLSAEGVRRSGPHFANLLGRKAGSLENYKYSKALTGAEFEWNEQALFDLFDKGPDKYLPGTKMPVQRVTDKKQLQQLIAYLKVLTSTPDSAE